MMVVQRLGVLSFGKLMGTLYGMLGLLGGCFFALVAMLGAFAQQGRGGGPSPAIMAVVSIVLFPIIYGILGFIGGIIMSALYNLAASIVGGVELELVPQQPGH